MQKLFYGVHCKNKPLEEQVDMPTFDFSVIAKATDNFSSRNKLGEGRFGPVYKVILGTFTQRLLFLYKKVNM